MVVEIILTKNVKEPEYNEDTSIRFDDEDITGDYWFLQPLFEKIRFKTSETIDLYDDCNFKGGQLLRLKEELIKEMNIDSNKITSTLVSNYSGGNEIPDQIKIINLDANKNCTVTEYVSSFNNCQPPTFTYDN
ncbi:hypothetical protein [Flammeovirga sp. SJP92]|uniref:hypothetical protein n=1 Tax=Flammeovirga sp. SJP92 TaxID=1775430 RepID=UPI000788BD4A|nr:hypothetical protein [Flammeovirga sp. SJP92]KXX69467.1 hypothetical protein AVL50_19135 [Flammeovirga sp. SJP92]